MTREERFKMDMIDEFKLMCEIVGNSGRIIANKHRMLKALEQEPFINKPCISEKVCEHDKNAVLDKIRAEILEKCFDVPYENQAFDYGLKIVKWSDVREVLDKYKAEQEET